MSINGKPINSGRDFMISIANTPVGQTARFKIFREGKQLEIPVVVAKRKSERELAKRFNRNDRGGNGTQPATTKASGRTGLMLTDLTPDIKRQLELEAGVTGAVIARIQRGSVAAAAGLAPGDVVMEIDRKKVRNAAEADRALSAKKDNFLLKISRGSATVIVLLDVSQPDGGGGFGEE
jgi:serine protease Do